MAKFGKHELLLAGSCLLCLAVAWIRLDDIGASEFSGGWLTGPIFSMANYGSVLFIPAMVLTFFYRQIAAGIALMASLLCLPIYLYSIAPGPFHWVFKAKYAVPPPGYFFWDNWAIGGIISLIVATFVSSRSFSAFKTKIEPPPENKESH